jgi:hypothetical protein
MTANPIVMKKYRKSGISFIKNVECSRLNYFLYFECHPLSL